MHNKLFYSPKSYFPEISVFSLEKNNFWIFGRAKNMLKLGISLSKLQQGFAGALLVLKMEIFLLDQKFKMFFFQRKNRNLGKIWFRAIKKFIMHLLTQSYVFWIKSTTRKKLHKNGWFFLVDLYRNIHDEQHLRRSLANPRRRSWEIPGFSDLLVSRFRS